MIRTAAVFMLQLAGAMALGALWLALVAGLIFGLAAATVGVHP